jgi:hypothetical protein
VLWDLVSERSEPIGMLELAVAYQRAVELNPDRDARPGWSSTVERAVFERATLDELERFLAAEHLASRG